ncbi:hypothetical protein ACTU6U_11775 [Microbacterium sp. A196]|uniref:hypothetical protein n=1 Tax=Microbacterium sp. A196 TaxID=3457320 RepID=UPI003FCEE86A
MKNTSLSRSIPYWLLLALSLVAAFVGGWLVLDNTSTMQRTLLDGSATNIEVYVGQAWITAGAAVLAAGIIGALLALGLAAVRAVVASPTPATFEESDGGAEIEFSAPEEASELEDTSELEEPDQNGSSGSIATATKTSVK